MYIETFKNIVLYCLNSKKEKKEKTKEIKI